MNYSGFFLRIELVNLLKFLRSPPVFFGLVTLIIQEFLMDFFIELSLHFTIYPKILSHLVTESRVHLLTILNFELSQLLYHNCHLTISKLVFLL